MFKRIFSAVTQMFRDTDLPSQELAAFQELRIHQAVNCLQDMDELLDLVYQKIQTQVIYELDHLAQTQELLELRRDRMDSVIVGVVRDMEFEEASLMAPIRDVTCRLLSQADTVTERYEFIEQLIASKMASRVLNTAATKVDTLGGFRLQST